MKQSELSQNKKRQFADSLKQLMKKKSLQKITIQEIADLCGSSRYTFYYHFKDIYDLLYWMFQEEAKALIKKSEDCITWEESFRLFLRGIRENKDVCKCAVSSMGQTALRGMFHNETQHMMKLFLNDHKGSRKIPEGYMSFLADFYIAALAGVIIEWVRRDFDISEDEMMLYLRLTLEGPIEQAIIQAEKEL